MTDSIPTEVLGPYTALVAIIVANSSHLDARTALRWWLYAVSLLLIVVYAVASYLGSANTARKLPWVELVSAMMAFAAWGLAMPGSPLSITVRGSDFAIASAIIAVGGAAVLGFFAAPLNSKSRKAKPSVP